MNKLVCLCSLILVIMVAFAGNVLSSESPEQVKSLGIPRIVGGEPVEDDTRYPWMVSLNYDSRYPDLYAGHGCGGTLIAPQWVLTAAHCVTSFYTPFHAVLGTTSLTAPPGWYERIGIRRVLRHKKYDNSTFNNDIALLQLAEPSSMTPISGLMHTDDYIPFETMFTAIGWGTTEFRGNAPEQLQEVSVPYVDNHTCQQSLEQEDMAVTDNMLCAGVWQGGQDSCQGDSGGPLIRHKLGRNVLAGVVSFGYECAVRAKPGVYTRVSMYTDWIETTAERECVFDALEQEFPQYFTMSSQNQISTTLDSGDIKFRSYPLSSSFLGTREDKLVYSGELSSYDLIELGTLDEWARTTGCDMLQ